MRSLITALINLAFLPPIIIILVVVFIIVSIIIIIMIIITNVISLPSVNCINFSVFTRVRRTCKYSFISARLWSLMCWDLDCLCFTIFPCHTDTCCSYMTLIHSPLVAYSRHINTSSQILFILLVPTYIGW